ncbi:hypothetical protein M1349_03875 [Patescibacteria group bacterium]|nr:hypothetical protein [Patescibacteria group bacterium]
MNEQDPSHLNPQPENFQNAFDFCQQATILASKGITEGLENKAITNASFFLPNNSVLTIMHFKDLDYVAVQACIWKKAQIGETTVVPVRKYTVVYENNALVTDEIVTSVEVYYPKSLTTDPNFDQAISQLKTAWEEKTRETNISSVLESAQQLEPFTLKETLLPSDILEDRGGGFKAYVENTEEEKKHKLERLKRFYETVSRLTNKGKSEDLDKGVMKTATYPLDDCSVAYLGQWEQDEISVVRATIVDTFFDENEKIVLIPKDHFSAIFLTSDQSIQSISEDVVFNSEVSWSAVKDIETTSQSSAPDSALALKEHMGERSSVDVIHHTLSILEDLRPHDRIDHSSTLLPPLKTQEIIALKQMVLTKKE